MRNNRNPNFTPEEDARLSALWNDGHTQSDIAKVLKQEFGIDRGWVGVSSRIKNLRAQGHSFHRRQGRVHQAARPKPVPLNTHGRTCRRPDKRKGFETCGEPKKPGWGMCEYHLETTAPAGNQFKTSRGY